MAGSITAGFLLGPFHGAIAVPSVTRCRCSWRVWFLRRRHCGTKTCVLGIRALWVKKPLSAWRVPRVCHLADISSCKRNTSTKRSTSVRSRSTSVVSPSTSYSQLLRWTPTVVVVVVVVDVVVDIDVQAARDSTASDICWMGVRRLVVANGPNIFQMLLVLWCQKTRCNSTGVTLTGTQSAGGSLKSQKGHGHSYNGKLIRTHTRRVEWRYYQWPCV